MKKAELEKKYNELDERYETLLEECIFLGRELDGKKLKCSHFEELYEQEKDVVKRLEGQVRYLTKENDELKTKVQGHDKWVKETLRMAIDPTYKEPDGYCACGGTKLENYDFCKDCI